MGLMQKEVAALAGVSLKDVVDKLATLFHIPPQDLLDEYNAFLYNDPAKAIREYRESLGLGRKRFAREIGAAESCICSWEENTKRVSRKSWEKYFKGKIK